jgi:hypothetical protein
MASLYKRSRSPFWWIKWRDERGKTQRESLGLRIGIGSETKRAREIRAERTLEEARAATSISRRGDKQDLVVWVPEWFRVRYSNSPLIRVPTGQLVQNSRGKLESVRAFRVRENEAT